MCFFEGFHVNVKCSFAQWCRLLLSLPIIVKSFKFSFWVAELKDFTNPKAEFKDFTIIDRESNTLHCQAKEALHIHVKDPSLNRNIGKVGIPSVFNKLLIHP